MKKIILALLLIPIMVFGQNNNDSTLSEFDIVEMDMVLLDLVNEYRDDNNLSPIEFSNRVWGVGYHHTTYMVRSGDLNHNEPINLNKFIELSFDKRGKRICDTVGKGSFSIGAYENLSRVYDTGDLWGVAEKILSMWISSPEHNSILLTKTNKSSSLYGASVSQSNKKRGVTHTKQICVYTTLNIVKVLN